MLTPAPRKAQGAILGLWDGHEASVALLHDGRLVFALSEERPARQKRASGFPRLALTRAVEWARGAGLPITDVAVAGRHGRAPLRLLNSRYAASSPHRDPLSPASLAVRAWENSLARLPGVRALERSLGGVPLVAQLRRALGAPFRLHLVAHHDAHAFSALLCPHAPDDAVLTWDAYGEGVAATLRTAAAPTRVVASLPVTAGLAILYGAVTVALGFHEGEEGKVMGLAAAGDPDRLRARVDALLAGPAAAPRLTRPLTHADVRRLVAGAAREDVAAALQAVVEARVTAWLGAAWTPPATGARLLLAGGLFANIRVNQALARLPGVGGLHVFPNMGDGGLSAGAAHHVWAAGHRRLAEPFATMFLGVVPDQGGIERALAATGLRARRVADPEGAAAERIVGGQVVCRYEGRDEFGPRALGHRSVLFSAARPGLPERVNRGLGRDGFMPFGPAVLADADAGLWAPLPADLATMTVSVDATPAFRRACPSAVHHDGTSRPQRVTARDAPGFHRLLTAVHARCGQPAVINTSFNRHREPIVHTPADALETFRCSGFDALYLGDWEVTPA